MTRPTICFSTAARTRGGRRSTATAWIAATLLAGSVSFPQSLAAQDNNTAGDAADDAVSAEVEDALGNLPDETADEDADAAR